MKPEAKAILLNIRELLERIHFPQRKISQQTAVCLYALLDKQLRSGLLAGKKSLNDAARVHDIIEFARSELRIRVAENTRESYRKNSLKPLFDAGLVSRVRTSVNDPHTHYHLNRTFEALLRRYVAEKSERQKQALVATWLKDAPRVSPLSVAGADSIAVIIDGEQKTLSPGKHNLLIKDIVEAFAPVFVDETPKVILLSDAEHKLKHVDPMAQELRLHLDKHEKMPDVILYSPTRNILYIVEAVTSAGPINEARIKDIERIVLPNKLSFGVEYFTAFPDRTAFKKFLDEIAWGTQVWPANEPFGVVIFRRVR